MMSITAITSTPPTVPPVSIIDLPLPGSGEISHIIQIADLHIRNGDEQTSRRAEYADVFDALLASLATMQAVRDESAVVVICGDVLHSRKGVDASTISQLNSLLIRLSAMAPVYIFSGNHCTDTAALSSSCAIKSAEAYKALDVLGSQVQSSIDWIRQTGGHCRIAYLESSGLYRAGSTAFGLVVMKDSLRKGNSRGYDPNLRPFPLASDLPPEVLHKFALFHGTITCRHGGVGMTGVNTMPLDWFGEDWTAVMLGDYHVQMVRNAKACPATVAQEALPPSISVGVHALRQPAPGVPLVYTYPGSTCQQDHGEGVYNHGYIVFDLAQSTVSKYHVPNTRGFAIMRRRSEGDGSAMDKDDTSASSGQWLISTGRFGDRSSWMTAAAAVALPGFPHTLKVRVDAVAVPGHDSSIADIEEVEAALAAVGVEVVRPVDHQYIAVDDVPGVPIDTRIRTPDDVGGASMSYYNTSGAFIDHVEKMELPDQPLDDLIQLPWRNWMTDVALTELPTTPIEVTRLLTDGAVKSTETRRKEFVKSIEVFRLASELNGQALARFPLKIVNLSWKYMLCFGADNWIDFRPLHKNLVVLNGRNGVGKSSTMEIVCWAIFGEGIPSREIKNQSSAVVCIGRPAGKERATVTVLLDVGGELYEIHRPLSVKAVTGNMSYEDATVSHVVAGEEPYEVASGGPNVDKWVARHVGDIQSFLASSMLTQYSDNCFFSKTGQKQVDHIDKIMGNTVITATIDVLHTAVKAHKSTLHDVQLQEGVLRVQVPPHLRDITSVSSIDDEVHAMQAERTVVATHQASIEVDLRAAEQVWAGVDPELGRRVAAGEGAALEAERVVLSSAMGTVPQMRDKVRELEVHVACLQQASSTALTALTDKALGSLDKTSQDLRLDMAAWLAERPDDVSEPRVSEADLQKMKSKEAAWRVQWAPLSIDTADAGSTTAALASSAAAACATDACRDTATLSARVDGLRSDVIRMEVDIGVAPVAHKTMTVSLSPDEARRALAVTTETRRTLHTLTPPTPKMSVQEIEAAVRAVKAKCKEGKTRAELLNDKAAAITILDDATRKRDEAVAESHRTDDLMRQAGDEEQTCRTLTTHHGRSRPCHAPPVHEMQSRLSAWRSVAAVLMQEATDITSIDPTTVARSVRVQVVDAGAVSSALLAKAAILQHRIATTQADAAGLRQRIISTETANPDYNPDCYACRKQSWKTQLDQLRVDLTTSEHSLTRLEHELSTLLSTTDVVEGLAKHRRTVADVATWIVRWDAQAAAGNETLWLQRVADAVVCAAWEEEDVRLRGVESATYKVLEGCRRVCGVARQRATDAAKQRDACQMDAARLETRLTDLVMKEALDEAQVARSIHRQWLVEVSAADEACVRSADALQDATELAAWTVSMDTWTARRDAIGVEVGKLREQLVATTVLLEAARLAEKSAKTASIVASSALAHAVRFVNEIDVVWRPLSASLTSETIAWATWGPWRARESALAHATRVRDLLEARDELDGARSLVLSLEKRARLEHAIDVGPSTHRSIMDLTTGLAASKETLKNLDQRLGAALDAAQKHAHNLALLSVMRTYCTTLQDRLAALEVLERGMGSYHSLLFKTVIGPRLEEHVNISLDLLQGDTAPIDRMQLVATWQETSQTFLWEMVDGAVGTVARGKGGGHQRASMALCMRLALAKISVVGTTSRHLFIDEGFTASDSSNMERVPVFLKKLVHQSQFDGIVLVSHVELLKDKADDDICIAQYVTHDANCNALTLSRIQYGERVMPSKGQKPVPQAVNAKGTAKKKTGK